MRGVVAQDLDTLRHLARDDRDRRIMVDQGRKIAGPAVYLDRDRRLREPRPDSGSELGAGHRAREFAAAAVGQGYGYRSRRMARRCRRVANFFAMITQGALSSVNGAVRAG
jgi:hypothetical protein